jgi:iron-sulfur cluster assembly accessory protein
MQAITADMTIGDLVQKYPSVAGVLQEEGVHCVGCGAAYYETIAQGLGGHGKTDEEIAVIVEKLNASIPEESGNEELIITDNAAKKLKEILQQKEIPQHGLRIVVKSGGCAGKEYAFSLVAEAHKGDAVHDVNGVKFFIANESVTQLQGAKIDFVDSLQGAGFKISNPNAKKSCACGSSFR